jgi:hypothetical protein
VRALLKPVVIPELGLVAFRPGSQLLPHFHRGRMLIENEPERLADLPSGEIPPAEQPLAEDPALIQYSLTRRCYVVLVAFQVWRTGYYVKNPASGRMNPGTLKTLRPCATHPA